MPDNNIYTLLALYDQLPRASQDRVRQLLLFEEQQQKPRTARPVERVEEEVEPVRRRSPGTASPRKSTKGMTELLEGVFKSQGPLTVPAIVEYMRGEGIGSLSPDTPEACRYVRTALKKNAGRDKKFRELPDGTWYLQDHPLPKARAAAG